MNDIIILNCVAYANGMGGYYCDLEGECNTLTFEAVCNFVEMQKYPVALAWCTDKTMTDDLLQKLYADVRSRQDLFAISENIYK